MLVNYFDVRRVHGNPWLCATTADLIVCGQRIDHPVVRGYDETPVRETILVLGMLLTISPRSPLPAAVWVGRPCSGQAGTP